MISAENQSAHSDLQQLASELQTYPITSNDIVQLAEQNGYREDLVKFLNLFSKDRVFRSREEFLDYCRLFKKLAGDRYMAVS